MDGPLAGFDPALWKFCTTLDVKMDIDSLADPKRKYYMTENMLDVDDVDMIRNMINNTHFFEYLPVTPGAQEGVQELIEFFDVWVCTKPLDANQYCRDDKMKWIKKHFPDLHEKVIMAPKKSLVHGDILLDDAPNHTCIPNSSWTPVVFTDTFNLYDEKWSALPHWTWGCPIEDLLKHAESRADGDR
jgi:5'(3')-deoxyribonucleotidase